MNIDFFILETEYIKVIDSAKKQTIGIYNSYLDASKALDMPPSAIKSIACTKTKRLCKKIDKEIVVRLISKIKAGAI